MKKIALAVATAALFSQSVNADTIAGLYIGGQIWDNEAAGKFGESGEQSDFNLADKQQGSYFAAFEHPIPFIPNVRLATTSLETDGLTTLDTEIEFGDETFTTGSEVDANFDVSYVDYTLYYELFDNGLFSFDIGLTGRDFDGDVTLSTEVTTTANRTAVVTTTTGNLSIGGIVPMLYASTEIGLPLTGLNVFAQGNFLSIDDHTLYDYQAGVSYELVDNLAVDVNLTLGFRSVKLELEDLSDLYSDLEFQGLFAGAVVHF